MKGRIREIDRAGMAASFLLTLIYELLRLTPLKNLVDRLRGGITEEAKEIEGIALVEYRDGKQGPKKLVIAQHGYGADKGRMRGFARRLARAGYFVVTPDACGHGGRREEGRFSIPDLVERGIADYDILIERYRGVEGIDAGDFSIVGSSMGGMMAYCYALRGKYRPRAIAPCISSPDFRDLMDYRLGLSYYEGHRIVHLEDEAEIEAANRRLAESNPFEAILGIEGVAVIALNMRWDFLMGHAGSDRLYEAWKGRKGPGEYRYLRPWAFFHYVPEVAQRAVVGFLGECYRSRAR